MKLIQFSPHHSIKDIFWNFPNQEAVNLMDLEKWSIFSWLNAEFVRSIRLACVFGRMGNKALVVTVDDDVYDLSSNPNGCLKLGDVKGIFESRKLEGLCKKNVKSISYGRDYLLAVTESGDVYGWGVNYYGQVGNGTTNWVSLPIRVSTNLLGKKVIDVACGYSHSLALTSEGEVFQWGHNHCPYVGLTPETDHRIPRKVTAFIGRRRVIVIACGPFWCMAVLDNGEVYGWGNNDKGQLGLGNKVDQIKPCRVVNLQNVVINQVVCGYAHTMALSDQGVLYAWGSNSFGQLGTGNKTDFFVPQIIAPEIGRVVEIASALYNDMSVAMTQTSKVYMWGYCRRHSVSTPVETPFHSMQEVFACFASPAVTWSPMKPDAVPVTRVSDSLRIAFDDPQTSDVKFLVEGKFIHVHKSVLKIRCEHFRSIFQDHYEEDGKNVIEIDQFSYPVYHAFLQYLYTDTVELPPEEVKGLLDLADCYCEQQLKCHCEHIKQGIMVDNVAAVKYDARMDLEKWTIFSLLSAEFVRSIRLACVLRWMGYDGLVVTVDDDVYGLSSYRYSFLGLGDVQGILESRKLEGLCKKNIKSISYGEKHLLAVTESGDLYGWGNNKYGQVGNGTPEWVSLPVLVTTNLLGKKVVNVACGDYHSLALTNEGEVFAWGNNGYGQLGSGSTTDQPIPRKVTTSIGGRLVIVIACGQHWSMVVLDNGEVFGWGNNDGGQLGLGNQDDQTNPCRVVNLQNVVIKQIVCGKAHTMALSDEGVLYAWGANQYGQLGTGNKDNFFVPEIVAPEIGRVVEIAASFYNHISVAMIQTSNVYMWGWCQGRSVWTPTETPFHSMQEVFACLTSTAATWKPMHLDVVSVTRVSDSFRIAFDDPQTSDVKFLVEGKLIHVHKSVLKIRCEHFRSMFQDHWEEDGKDVIEIDHFSYSVYHAFLQYLYTDTVKFPPEEAIDLFDLANCYCEQQLKCHCERIMKQGITVDNVIMMYAAAIKYEARELEEFCFRFVRNHTNAIIQTDAFLKLEEPILKNFVVKAAQYGAFKY